MPTVLTAHGTVRFAIETAISFTPTLVLRKCRRSASSSRSRRVCRGCLPECSLAASRNLSDGRAHSSSRANPAPGRRIQDQNLHGHIHLPASWMLTTSSTLRSISQRSAGPAIIDLSSFDASYRNMCSCLSRSNSGRCPPFFGGSPSRKSAVNFDPHNTVPFTQQRAFQTR